jgi:hypothetical protein
MSMPALIRVAVFGCAVGLAPVMGAPFIPKSDSQVLEQLPFAANDPTMRELRGRRDALNKEPANLPLALGLARRYLELGRVTGDPRYAGYAEAALAPWWNLEKPPDEILVLRATMRQRVHQFGAALADLAAVLAANPRNAQARLTRATVLQVQGSFSPARKECLAVQNLTQELISTACLANANGVTGKLHQSYAQLREALERRPAQRHASSTAAASWAASADSSKMRTSAGSFWTCQFSCASFSAAFGSFSKCRVKRASSRKCTLSPRSLLAVKRSRSRSTCCGRSDDFLAREARA